MATYRKRIAIFFLHFGYQYLDFLITQLPDL
jgi:hypothetical protein